MIMSHTCKVVPRSLGIVSVMVSTCAVLFLLQAPHYQIDVMETMTSYSSLEPFAPMLITQSGEVVEVADAPSSLVSESEPRLNHDAHRRWRANTSVEFLNKVKRIDILETRTDENRTVLYVLQVRLTSQSSPVLTVERSFSEFEELRQRVQCALSIMPPCRCQFCLDFLVYIRFKMEQPRGIIKLTTGIEKRKKILAQFMGDVVTMGRRRVEKPGKRECEKQLLIPVLLEEFLVGEKNGEC